MKKFLSLIVIILICQTAFAYSSDEIVGKMKQIRDLKGQIAVLLQERTSQEQALVEDYKVKEVNQKRNALAIESADKIVPLEKKIEDLQNDIEANL